MFEEVKAKMDAVNAELDAAKAEMQRKIRESFKEATVMFFEAVPEVAFLTWKQFTPYFNDDEECVFGRNESTYVLAVDFLRDKGDLEEDDLDITDRIVYDAWGAHSPVDLDLTTLTKERFDEIQKACRAFERILIAIDDEFYKNAFGGDSTVTVTRQKVISEEYGDHD